MYKATIQHKAVSILMGTKTGVADVYSVACNGCRTTVGYALYYKPYFVFVSRRKLIYGQKRR